MLGRVRNMNFMLALDNLKPLRENHACVPVCFDDGVTRPSGRAHEPKIWRILLQVAGSSPGWDYGACALEQGTLL